MTATEPGKLFIVSTPIGNLDDITPRALNTLKSVDLVAAEDTRHTSKLFHHFGIQTPIISLHEHNEGERSHKIVERLETGQQVALVSDAGTPLVSDPGYFLVSSVAKKGIEIVPVVGACALIAALSVSGLSTDRFTFEGFLPAKTSQRKKKLDLLAKETRTLIFYESKHRLSDCLSDMSEVFDSERLAVLCRELTKAYETVYRGTLKNLWQLSAEGSGLKGEFVIVVQGFVEPEPSENTIDDEALQWLSCLVKELPVKKAASIVASRTIYSKNQLYKLALERFNP
ncbi:MAG: 16S rRNA (cytidine(1402)-2'-O)-methyltransferase [Pseudomonadota bacterium]